MVSRIVLLALMALLQPQTARGDDWRSLFNGNDLAGWKANNDPESFRVVDGVLRVQAAGKTSAHLFVVQESGELERFRNFELELEARAEPNSNGGVFVHTDMSTRDKALHLAKGYEVQLNSSTKEKRKTGSLYAIVDYNKSPLDESQWFRVNVVVEGKRIRIRVNDVETVDYTEPEDVVRPPERRGRLFSAVGGGIALQAHDAGSVWYFRNLRIKRLP